VIDVVQVEWPRSQATDVDGLAHELADDALESWVSIAFDPSELR
jgi:hypothetical protein